MLYDKKIVSNVRVTIDNDNFYATHLSILDSLTFSISFDGPSLGGSVLSKNVSDKNDKSSHIESMALVSGPISNDWL